MKLALVVASAFVAFGQSNPWYQTDFPPDEFKARWTRVLAAIGDNGVAVLQGVSQTPGFITPRQSNDFYYLCGIETPHSYLLIDGRTKKVTLFLPPRNAQLENAEGKVLSASDTELVKRLTGADDVQSTEAMRSDFLRGGAGGGGGGRGLAPLTIYTPFSPAEGAQQSRGEVVSANAAIVNDLWDGRTSREARFAELLRARNPRARIEDLTPIVDEMRSVKSPREIALIRRASQIAGLGIMEAMRSTKPGLYEFHLDAAARYVFLVNDAKLEGYRSITAAGTPNIWNMHYYRNNAPLKDGDLVLLDFAPDYRYYTSDVTRMWPVNGKYSPVQRELLAFVLEYRNAVMKQIRPGTTTQEIMERAKAAMTPVFARWKFSKPEYEKAARVLVDRGGGVLSHPVGMAVHDDGPYNRGPLKVGHVFSIDPQLRVPEENLYIRYEDVIVVTENGMENFTDFLPSELNDMEKLVGSGGVVQKAPPIPESALPRPKPR
jgi:Xaa-Pro aminopeptidase